MKTIITFLLLSMFTAMADAPTLPDMPIKVTYRKALMDAGSSPVVGTIFDEVKRTPQASSCLGNLSGGIAEAYAAAGHALLNLANALKGEGNFSAHSSPAPIQGNPLTLTAAVNELLIAKTKSGKSDRYIRALRNSLSKFVAVRGRVELSKITHQEIEEWLGAQSWAPRTQLGYLSDLRTLYNFAMRRGYVNFNPANAVERPQLPNLPPGIHSPQEVKTALEAARRHDLNLCRSLAIRYFGGLRSSEAERLQEFEISAKYIEVTAAKAKTRRRRLVTVLPNLKTWLALGGTVDFGDYEHKTAAFYKISGVHWPQNVTRHSFISYHVAKFQNAGKTALEAGHSETMLFSHYRETATPESAAEYFSIVPD